MRSRFLEILTNQEVADYLKRNDVLYVPVGTIENSGEFPLGQEHVLPLAFGKEMAEKSDGLVLSHLAYFYAGATGTGEGTIRLRPSVGTAYLKELFHSLWQMGFHRQIVLSAHGPASVTLAPAVREYFEESGNSPIYIDLDVVFAALEEKFPGQVDPNKLRWGAYQKLGRLDEIPEVKPAVKMEPYPPEVIKLQRARSVFGYYFHDATQNGWWPEKPFTPADREAWAREGAHQLDFVVEQMNPPELVKNIRGFQEYMARQVFSKYQERLK